MRISVHAGLFSIVAASLSASVSLLAEAAPTGPAFSCAKVAQGSIEALVCADAELSALDRKLAGVYSSALKKAANEKPPQLKATQRGWVKGRNDCWKASDKRTCVKDSYTERIVELQARYRLVKAHGPVRYVCDGNPANEVIATYFDTEPKSAIAERGDSTSLMRVQPSGSGAKYQGPNESLWEHQGEATIVWGYGAPEMRCKVAR